MESRRWERDTHREGFQRHPRLYINSSLNAVLLCLPKTSGYFGWCSGKPYMRENYSDWTCPVLLGSKALHLIFYITWKTTPNRFQCRAKLLQSQDWGCLEKFMSMADSPFAFKTCYADCYLWENSVQSPPGSWNEPPKPTKSRISQTGPSISQ